eukprot:Gb_12037 [translate_table: standard]
MQSHQRNQAKDTVGEGDDAEDVGEPLTADEQEEEEQQQLQLQGNEMMNNSNSNSNSEFNRLNGRLQLQAQNGNRGPTVVMETGTKASPISIIMSIRRMCYRILRRIPRSKESPCSLNCGCDHQGAFEH